MGTWLWRLSSCTLTILVWGSLCTGTDLESAKRAYEQKDYATAFKEIAPLAEPNRAHDIGIGTARK